MAFPAARHDHAVCVQAALAAAEQECRRQGARLTEIRRQVLGLVWESHCPVGAYALLDGLARLGRSAAPPTVYRALDFLLAHGLIHRVASRNGFIGCPRPGHRHCAQILICVGCGMAAELNDPTIDRAIDRSAADLGFAVSRQTLEIEGLCPTCRARRAASPAAVAPGETRSSTGAK